MLFETETNGKPEKLTDTSGYHLSQHIGHLPETESFTFSDWASPSLIQRVRPAHAQKLDTDEATPDQVG
jgi:hypothetical protein